MSPERILIVGLGRTGLSLGLALRGVAPAARVTGFDRDPDAARAAAALGAVHEIVDPPDAPPVSTGVPWDRPLDLLALALPPAEAAGAVALWGPRVPPGTLLMDLASLMLPSVQAAASVPDLAEQFVPAHPVVEETAEGAPPSADRFRGVHVLIGRPIEPGAPAERVAMLWRSLGAEPSSIAPTLHDALVALTRHLPLLSAAALTRTLRRTGEMTRLVAPEVRGWLDSATRPVAASGSAAAATLALNAPKLLPALELLEREIRGLRRALAATQTDSGGPTALAALLEEASRFRRELVA